MQMNKVTRFREQGYFFVIERQICNTNTCKKIVITCNFVSKHRMRSQMQRLDQFGSVFTAVMGLSKYIKNPRLTYIFPSQPTLMLITTNLGYLGSDFDIDHSFSGLLPLSCSKRLEQVDSKCFTNYSIDDIFCSNKTVQLLPLYERWEGIVGYDFPL